MKVVAFRRERAELTWISADSQDVVATDLSRSAVGKSTGAKELDAAPAGWRANATTLIATLLLDGTSDWTAWLSESISISATGTKEVADQANDDDEVFLHELRGSQCLGARSTREQRTCHRVSQLTV